MVQTIVDLGPEENRIVNTVKGIYGLKNKNDAINFVISAYGEEMIESEIRPEYMKKLLRIMDGEFTEFKDIEDLKRIIENIPEENRKEAQKKAKKTVKKR